MRFWRPVDETPAGYGSRPVQVLLLVAVLGVVGGIVAASVVDVDPPWARVAALAVMALGLVVLAASLIRSWQVRRHVAGRRVPGGGDRGSVVP